MEKEDSFPQRVWQIVAAIPEGYVTTYGDVAKLAALPCAARQVGGVLSVSLKAAPYPGTGWLIATAQFR